MPPDDTHKLRRHEVIEQLAEWGEMLMRFVVPEGDSTESAWLMVQHIVNERIAALWVTEDAPRGVEGVVERELEQWEVAALARTCLNHTFEKPVRLERLILRAGPKIKDAYRNELGF